MIEPKPDQVERAARALAEAKDLDWSKLKPDFREEITAQARLALRAGLNEDWHQGFFSRVRNAPAAMPATAVHQVDLEELLGPKA